MAVQVKALIGLAFSYVAMMRNDLAIVSLLEAERLLELVEQPRAYLALHLKLMAAQRAIFLPRG